MARNDYPEKALYWVDVETSGLVAHQHLLLEVACLVTDLNLNLLDETGFQAKILHRRQTLVSARERADDVVRDMHDRSGLWDACADPTQATPLPEVDAALHTYIRGLNPEVRTGRIAGNSVRLDLNFLEQHLPKTAGHMVYRMMDVSSLAGAARWWAGAPTFEKKYAHTAMSDIRESIAELSWLRKRLGLTQAAA